MLTVQSGSPELGKEFDKEARQAVFVASGQRLVITPTTSGSVSDS